MATKQTVTQTKEAIFKDLPIGKLFFTSSKNGEIRRELRKVDANLARATDTNINIFNFDSYCVVLIERRKR